MLTTLLRRSSWPTRTRPRRLERAFCSYVRPNGAHHEDVECLVPIPSRAYLEGTAEFTEVQKTNITLEEWLAKFRSWEIPRSFVDFTFSRSSGPGGQNVNKVNTKATLRVPLKAKWIPVWAHEEIRKSLYYVSSSNDIMITSSLTRSQAENRDDCMKKLHSLILSTAKAGMFKGCPEELLSAAQIRVGKERRRREKEKQRDMKRSRAGKDRDWD